MQNVTSTNYWNVVLAQVFSQENYLYKAATIQVFLTICKYKFYKSSQIPVAIEESEFSHLRFLKMAFQLSHSLSLSNFFVKEYY